ncbi:helix-hairpin-helix domain-containing protein [uncultured Oscillibacter sp.]|uniref:helix-hairpin-helix domain-containing protein n=1 Tax=uncultured Oscillibacter sp. TaxID=876091 RepID=UPI0025F7A5AC|nr:helix-hairpin-helix domain-containing protein [uncultured Oscillibacter sp.]
MKHPLTEIPGVGDRIAAVMETLGIRRVSDLRGRDPEELYARECLMKGYQEDRCALYVWRTAVYYADHETRDPEKLKWWYWKDKTYPEKEDL